MHGVLEHHDAGLGDGALAGIEFDLDVLHFVAANEIIDLVGPHGTFAAAADRRDRAKTRHDAPSLHFI